MEVETPMSSSSSLFMLCLKISCERFEREKEELMPLLREEKENKKRRFIGEEVKEEIKKQRLVVEEEEGKKKTGKRLKKRSEKKELQVVQHGVFLDLNEKPNPMWDEINASKPTFVFNRMLTDSDVRRNLTRCILNRQEMMEVLLPALTEEENGQVYEKERKLGVVVVDQKCEKRYQMKLVWWPSLKQFALVNGWTDFVDDNGLVENDIIQVSYFRFGDEQQLGLLIHCRPELVEEGKEEDEAEGEIECA